MTSIFSQETERRVARAAIKKEVIPDGPHKILITLSGYSHILELISGMGDAVEEQEAHYVCEAEGIGTTVQEWHEKYYPFTANGSTASTR